MKTRKAFIAAATALTVSTAGMTSAGAVEQPNGHVTQHLPGSSAESVLAGVLPALGILGAAGWAAFEWLKQNPQQLTITF